ncbi:MFS transporter [Chitinimonas lacunae]|uniref:MFS transporter n=1 Tax=Chitinimonas lacunae TaxID=1963018 RepID=A0ABV8MRP0_9NEIS
MWRHPDFLKLWLAQGISDFGSHITQLALPLTAAVMLNATPMQMGILGAVEMLPFALFSLHAGVLIDRQRRMPLMLGRDIAAALILLLVPLAVWGGWLSMEVLFLVGFLHVTTEVFGGSAHQSYVATLVGRERLVEAHSKLMTTASTAQVTAPGLAGLLVQILTAPIALLFDALSFLVSALILTRIRTAEPEPQPDRQRSVMEDIRAGLSFIRRTPLLRVLALQAALWQLLFHMLMALLVLFATRELGLSAAQMGMCFMLGGLGSLVAALTAERLGERFGVGPMMGWGMAFTALAWLLFSLIPRSGPTMFWFSAVEGLLAFGATLFSIHYLAARAALTPDALLGRMIASMRFLTVTPAPLGALIGGGLGSTLGLRPALLAIGLGGMVLAAMVVCRSPVRHLHSLPKKVEELEPAAPGLNTVTA